MFGLLAEQCTACHGVDMEGAPDWQRSGPDGPHGNQLLFDYVHRGRQAALDDLRVGFKSCMRGFGDMLRNEEIEAVLSCIRSTCPSESKKFRPRVLPQMAKPEENP